MRQLRIYKNKLVKWLEIIKLVGMYIHNSAQNAIKILPDNDKKIIFTLEDDMLFRSDDGCGRLAYNILRLFSEMGFNVYFCKNISAKGFKHLSTFGRFIYSIKNVKFIKKVPQNTEDFIYAFDTAIPAQLNKKWKKLIYVNALKPTNYKYGNILWVPFDLFPWMYRYKQDQRIPEFRKFSKTLRILFGGNTTPGYYDNLNLRRYNQITRREGIAALLGKVDGVEEIQDLNQFIESIEQKELIKKCLLLRTEKVDRIDRRKWLEIVARSDFFLCLSGTDYPMCHNTIEAMALGVIPILGYPDWFLPPLTHMKNAIVYSGQEDLANKIKEVLSMPEDKIKELRSNVMDYYDQFMTPRRSLKDLENDKGNICTFMFYPKLLMTQEEQQKFAGIGHSLEKFLGRFESLNIQL